MHNTHIHMTWIVLRDILSVEVMRSNLFNTDICCWVYISIVSMHVWTYIATTFFFLKKNFGSTRLGNCYEVFWVVLSHFYASAITCPLVVSGLLVILLSTKWKFWIKYYPLKTCPQQATDFEVSFMFIAKTMWDTSCLAKFNIWLFLRLSLEGNKSPKL